MELIKVAIADANVLFREGLKRVLAAERDLLVVGEAGDDVEVADTVERTRPDVLLLDLEIPTRKAVPILLELKQKNVPINVLILSFFPDPESILDTAKAGASGYALKCILPSTLIQAIRKIHRGEIWVDRQLNCAETFVEIAREKSAYDVGRLEDELAGVLSKRELEVLAVVAKGFANQEVSKKLSISLQTVKIHLNHIFHKLGVTNRTQAALLFLQAYHNESAAEVEYGKRGAVSRLDNLMAVKSGAPQGDPPFRWGRIVRGRQSAKRIA